MKYAIPYITVAIVLLYGIYNGYTKQKENRTPPKQNTKYSEHIKLHTTPHITEELQNIDSPAYTKTYIVNVINHGSSMLHFKKDEIMEGGFASSKDAPMIACYVMSLAGESCNTPFEKEAAMYYSSNCAGCHGEDAKGLNGTYPDLTQRPLLGIAKRKTLLKRLLRDRISEQYQ